MAAVWLFKRVFGTLKEDYMLMQDLAFRCSEIWQLAV